MAEPLNLDVQSDYVPEERLPDLVLDASETGIDGGTDLPGAEQPALITLEQVKAFLKYAYDAHGLALKERDIWKIEEPELTQIAEGLLSYVNGSAPEMVRNAIRVVDMTGGVGVFLWSYGTRLYLTYQHKQELKAEQIQTMEDPMHGPTAAASEPSARPKYFIP